MSLIKIAKTLRENWKKSVFAAGVSAYGISYAIENYEINNLMRAYCKEAEKYGDMPQNVALQAKKIIVILNPAANKKSAEKTFQKYCEPILHLSGFLVDIIKTDSEGHARRYIENLDKLPDGILVAGGDGTLSETVTGLMRRIHKNNRTISSNEMCPIGVLPLGRTNSVAKKVNNLHSKTKNNIEEIRDLVESTMTVVRGKTKKKDVMKIQILSDKLKLDENETSVIKATPKIINDKENENQYELKPIYAMGSLHWGAFRDARSYRDKYWYVGPLRDYMSILFHAFDNNLTWNCKAKLIYTSPCEGCSNCYIKQENQKPQFTGRWWSRFIPKFSSHLGQNVYNSNQTNRVKVDYSKIINEKCNEKNSIEISPAELILSINNVSESVNNKTIPENSIPKLEVCVGNSIKSSFDFITQSWKRIKDQDETKILNKEIEARTIELIPDNTSDENNSNKEFYFSIDNEAYEVKPIKVVLIPRVVELYTP